MTIQTSIVSRTYRAAIRIGEDFYTIEEVITLPDTATDEDIAQAIDLGTRIYTTQAESVAAQVAMLRTQAQATPGTSYTSPPPAASQKQLGFIADLAEQLGWSTEQLATYAGECGFDMATLSKAQASTLINSMKGPITRQATAGATQAHTPIASLPQDEDLPF